MQTAISIPADVLLVVKTLRQAGYDAYLVGGAVRDLLRHNDGSSVLDYDFTTNATPERLQALFPESFYENTFGTVSVTSEELRKQFQLPIAVLPAQQTLKNRVIDVAQSTKIHSSLAPQLNKALERYNHSDQTPPPYQITTYRSEDEYLDHRRPSEVHWGQTLHDDLSRRDFTINALAISLSDDFVTSFDQSSITSDWQKIPVSPDQFQIHDPFHGLEDLQNGLIKTVGEPSERFHEDALRLLRVIRFSVQLGFRIEDTTYHAVRAQHQLIEHISGERIRDEFLKILVSANPRKGIKRLDGTGLLEHIVPELLSMKGVQQGGHHTTDVWVHTLDAVQACPSTDPIVKLATLLHDIGKPATFRLISGSPTFYGHEVIGARIAKQIAQRLRLSRDDVERIFILVRYHMFHYQPELTDAAIRRMMRNIGLGNLDDMLDLREGDRLGSGASKTSWRLEELKQRMINQLHQPLDVTDLAVSGNDVMDKLKLPPGPIIGALLQRLFEHVMDHPEDNQRATLLQLASAMLAAEKSQ